VGQPLDLRPAEDAAWEVVEVEQLAAVHGVVAPGAWGAGLQVGDLPRSFLLVLPAEAAFGGAAPWLVRLRVSVAWHGESPPGIRRRDTDHGHLPVPGYVYGPLAGGPWSHSTHRQLCEN
jgi:hypothetical protein